MCTLDGDKLASALLRMVMVSAELGHKRPEYTARDYCAHLVTPEGRFVRDILTLSTEEMCNRWYGGVFHAAAVGAELHAAPLRAAAERRRAVEVESTE